VIATLVVKSDHSALVMRMDDRSDGRLSSHPACIFCKIIAREEPCTQLYEDDNTLAFMDKHPANDGHCLVIPKKHYETIFETPPEDFAAVARTLVKIAAAVQCALQPAGLNLLQANGPAAGQSVQHLHVHVLPRRDEDHLPINWLRHHEGYPIHIAEFAARIRGHL
jgi:histidine triad (HIT) family protein